ncbi:MAG: flagellar filament capping protein FliD [Bacillota bacterium]|jgi:flagellar hook-associated protein 2
MTDNLRIDGLGSGFKTTDVVKKLMAVERQPLTLLEQKKNTVNRQADAWREMNTRLNALKEAAYALQSADLFQSRAAAINNNEALDVTRATGAALDKYDIGVKRLAKSHSITSDTKNSIEKALHYKGTFKINSKAVKVRPDDNLKQIAAKINQTAGGNVAASIVQVANGKFQLVLASKNMGAGDKITLKDGGIGRGVLTNLGILTWKDKIKNEVQAADDAVITVNGVKIQRPTNQIDDAIANVTLNLKKENTGTKLTIDIDREKILAAARTFVEKYNGLMEYVNQNSGYAAVGSSAAFGSSTLMQIQSELRRTLQPQVSGVAADVSLLELVGIKGKSGIDGAKSGQLELDEKLFRAKLDKHYDDIAKVFGATDSNGVFKQMYDVLFNMTGTAGLVDNKIKTTNREMTELNKQITTMGERLGAKEQAYYKKFNTMEQTLLKLKNQQKWLAAQLTTVNINNNTQKSKEGAF